jgi:hypothetical protein
MDKFIQELADARRACYAMMQSCAPIPIEPCPGYFPSGGMHCARCLKFEDFEKYAEVGKAMREGEL